MQRRNAVSLLQLLAIEACFATFGSASTLLVLNKEGTVAIVDPTTQKVLGHAPTGGGPHEVVATTDGKLAVASNYGSQETPGHSLSVIDIASRQEIHRVDVAPMMRPHGLFAADGKVYFTTEGTQEIGRYDPATNSVDWRLRTGQDGTHMVALSKDGRLIFTSNIGSGTISIFERSGNPQDWHGTVVNVGKGVEGFDLSPDGKQLWAANARDGTVSIIDVSSKRVIQTFKVGAKRSNRLKFTPDGKRVLISDITTGDLFVLDVASRTEIKHFNLGHSIAGILVEPEGKRAYVAATSDNYVAIVDLKSLVSVGHIQTGNGPDGMDWIGDR
jgi:YVTN family beta-propeller protein